MALKKGKKIWAVYIDRGIVTAFTKDMEPIPLNRSERNALSHYKNKDYIENVCIHSSGACKSRQGNRHSEVERNCAE